ncbi:M24 family metallopeptidase [Bremerella cremea]|uniref:Xaa-Pro aminopeptidase n=1 Tax=Blastopirellula marina TaxID=124 RepID=A0A2S8FZQ7_9BACT|nr:MULTISPECIES: M24 family metallopeptidase [Pirellulaceae]PQO37678.1 Xaa-Pro aminopeptidase [Blastopirellula marina]RCS50065.1 M24 family metallopeptidase [Bremerella cremea]
MNDHRHVQAIAKSVLEDLAATIQPADTERTIAKRCVDRLHDAGITQTWYYDCPAYVLLGSRSCLSISGRDYVPADEVVGETNVVTVDLSPLYQEAWGDCARSFYVEEGNASLMPTRAEFVRGDQLLRKLHVFACERVHTEMTFEELHSLLAEAVVTHQFESIDFLGNFGHSIEKCLTDRKYIEAGNASRLSDVPYFTIEPHIRELGGNWGYKWEEIYTFGTDGRIHAI